MSARELILSALKDPEPVAVPLCSVCRLATGENETGIWRPDPGLCATLGLPADYVARRAGVNGASKDSALVVCAIPGRQYGMRWDAYTLEFVCVPFYGILPGPTAKLEWRSSDPQFADVGQDYQVWRARVYRKRSHLFLEVTWDVHGDPERDPTGGARLAVRGLEHKVTKYEVDWALQSRALLYSAVKIRRRRREITLQQVVLKRRQVWEELGRDEEPEEKDVAAALGKTPKTVLRVLQEKHIPSWAEFQRRYPLTS
jgi:hypothetical protein